jgi:hypothetical protein
MEEILDIISSTGDLRLVASPAPVGGAPQHPRKGYRIVQGPGIPLMALA